MDDFVISNLHESRNEWCGRLVSLLTPLIIEGIRSIYNEAWKMCETSNEKPKYLMTFQNMLSRIPKWNSVILEEECKRLIDKSHCNYLEDLITCVHIIQLKVLTCVRVGNKQKKIDISVPKLDHFIHRVYILVARKVYSNVYLFERGISDLSVQKNNRELEIITQECILTAIRESIPTEAIIRAYMDESIEEEEEVIIEPIPDKEHENSLADPTTDAKDSEVIAPEPLPVEELPPTLTVSDLNDEKPITRLSFNDVDGISDGSYQEAPKTIERLEEISDIRNAQRKLEDDDDDDDDVKESIQLHMDKDVFLDDIIDLDKPAKSMDSMPKFNTPFDIEDL
jgi:hypothetical protein